MEILTLISVLLGLVALICFLGGINLLRKGAMPFLPANTSAQPVLDNLLRFLAGIYFSCGFLFVYAALATKENGILVFLLGGAVIMSGVGRLSSRLKVGSAGTYFDRIMWFEMILGLAIISLRVIA
jgi:hypothetical protein